MTSRNAPVTSGNSPPSFPEPDAPMMLHSHGISARQTSANAWTTFDDFYRMHAFAIGTALEITLNNRELAEDARNEAMARALHRWRRVSTYRNPEGWVYRVAMSWALSWLRRRRREGERPLTMSATQPAPTIPDQQLQQAIEGLSVDHRSVVACRYFLDWSVIQTAEALNIAEGTVKSRLARALDHIRDGMDDTP